MSDVSHFQQIGDTAIFSPIQTRETLSEIVASQIEDAIRQKKFVAGDKLPSEVELCNQFSVSRTAVREALRTLSAKGLVEIIKGKGMFIRESNSDVLTDHMHLYLQLNIERDFVLDLVHARQIIEPEMAMMAALHHTEEDEKKLNADIAEFSMCEGPITKLASLDMQFHLDVARASQNAIMPLLLAPIHKLIPEIKSSVYATNNDARESALIWHRKVLDAILRRDPESARSAMVQHLKIAEEHALVMLRTQESLSKTK
jgi:GntR family transcriptional regulator, transcriptional repressor for pyruvate dehydrogenase complex